jgi:alginate O-acetyltransferase complex protein AlgJ
VLGDSFANIFSLEALGWGESAGFVEHLSIALGGRPLDCILRNSDGAFATREMLAQELARGRDRLAGKKLVIWEFAARELAFGDWKLMDLRLGAARAARFFSPTRGEEVETTGTIAAVSSVPAPGRVPYRDHIMAVELADVDVATQPGSGKLQAVVYLWSMRDNVWTSAARLRPGDKVTLRLRAWADVSAQYEQINRSEIDNPELQLEEPVWGELLQ